MYVVDASVWVSRFVLGDDSHLASRIWLGAVVDRGEVVAAPAIALPEVAGAVARRVGSPDLASRAVALLQQLPNVRLVTVDSALAQLAARLAAELRLRGADALYVALAHHLGVALITWDREQLSRAGDAVTALTPQEALLSPR